MLDYEEKMFSLTKLFTHLMMDCTEKMRICPMCEVTLENSIEMQEHIQRYCSVVQIECETCNKKYTRDKFKEHICYTKYKNYRDVIELKHD